MNHFNKFSRMIGAMAHHPQIQLAFKEVPQGEMEEFLIDIIVQIAESEYGHKFPSNLKPYISVSSGTSIRWFYNRGEKEKVGGEFQLIALNVGWTMAGKTGIPNDFLEPEEQALLPTMAVIDQRPRTGDGMFTMISVVDGKSLYFHDRGRIFKLTLSYETYLDCLLDLKGYGGWQLLFCEGNLKNADHFNNRFLDEFDDYLADSEILFPDLDLRKYKEQISELRIEYGFVNNNER